MATPDLQRRGEIAAIGDLEVAARVVAAGLRHGRHAAPLVGAGPEVWGLRPYRQGDDAAQVDWKRSARGDRLYSRERVDASHTQALLVVDTSRSMAAGHRHGEPSKLDVARVAAAALAMLLVDQGDTVGLFAATTPVTWLPPAGGAHHGHVLIDALAGLVAAGTVGPARLVDTALAHLRRPSLVVVLSDGWDDAIYAEGLARAAASGHDVAVLTLSAPGDRELAATGVVELEDAETGAVVAIDAAVAAAPYAAAAAAHAAALDARLRGARLDTTRLDTATALAPQLRRWLLARSGRSRA
ncbi:MAG: DUF58 domain-containing protein [Vicinamibacterales bacterium]